MEELNENNHIQCGSQMETDVEIHKDCGSSQKEVLNPKKKFSSFVSQMSPKVRIGLIITGIWIILHLVLLFSDPLGPNSRAIQIGSGWVVNNTHTNKIWFVETDFFDFEEYGLGEFMFYGALLPAIFWGAAYLYRINRKIAIAIPAVFVLVSVGFWGVNKYAQYSKYCKEHPSINRTFADCEFGDKYADVLETLKKNYGKFINRQLTKSDKIVLDKVTYGNNYYDRLNFVFYNDKLYSVYFKKVYGTEQSRDADYDSYDLLFRSKGYAYDDLKENIFSNCHYYSDTHTELKLRYSVPDFDGDELFINISYYDKDSGQREEGL